jgi:hypothetical protein
LPERALLPRSAVERAARDGQANRRTTEFVLQILRGQNLDALSEEPGVSLGRLAEWLNRDIAAMLVGLEPREPDYRDGCIHDLKAKTDDQAMQIELLERKIEIVEESLRPPPRESSP